MHEAVWYKAELHPGIAKYSANSKGKISADTAAERGLRAGFELSDASLADRTVTPIQFVQAVVGSSKTAFTWHDTSELPSM